MGYSAYGVASPPIPGFNLRMLSELLRCSLLRIDVSGNTTPRFDTRKKGDVRVVAGERFHSIENTSFLGDILFHDDRSAYDRFLDVTGVRGRVVFFGATTSGDEFGFSAFEDGRPIRRRHCSLAPQLRSIARGEPLSVERPWKPAILTEAERSILDPEDFAGLEFFRNEETQEIVTEYNLVNQLVDAVLVDEFGFCVADGVVDGQTVREEFYRAPEEVPTEAQQVQARPRRP